MFDQPYFVGQIIILPTHSVADWDFKPHFEIKPNQYTCWKLEFFIHMIENMPRWHDMNNKY